MSHFDRKRMDGMVGGQVQMNLKGPEAMNGMLMDVRSDYCVLQAEDDMVYYNLDHVKSVTQDSSYSSEEEYECRDYIREDCFADMLEALRYKWVRINRGGPEHVEGVLVKVRKDYILLIKEKELVHISLYHIKSISPGRKKEESNEDEKKD